MGILGAAIAALGGVVLLHTLVLIEVRTMFGVYPVGVSTLKPLTAALVMLGVETVVGGHTPGPLALRIAAVIVAGLLSYGGVLLVLGLAPEERELVQKWWRRIRRRDTPGE
jgi:hypothetical protein